MSNSTCYEEIPKAEDYQPHDAIGETETKISDPASSHEQVPMYMWMPGLIAVLCTTCVVMKTEFNMPVSEVLLALFLAFFFSFLAIQATGATGK